MGTPKATSGKSGASAPASQEVLLGSSTLPAVVLVGDAEVQLGTIVAGAHTVSGLSVKDWNALDEAKRDELLNAHIETLRAAAAEASAEAKRLEDERLAAERAEQDRKDAEDEAARQRAKADAHAALFPRKVTVRNNGPVALSEPVSGSYTHAGGSSEFTLHDADHAHAVLENFRALLAANYLQPEVLSFEGLPE